MATRRVRPLETKAMRTKELERMAIPMRQVKALDGAQGKFEGYLAIFSNIDDNGDFIEPGAFKKTLADAYEVKKRTSSPFVLPLLWMHDDKLFPAGGFTDMSEDQNGLYVKGQCDLNTEMGRNVFSGMQMGYINGLSIGYYTIKATRDTKGVRHLAEVRLVEGSAITVGYQANPLATVLSTKTRSGRAERETKGASGKTSWPFADADTAWDGAAAHNNIVAWATKADGSLDEGKMQSVHFWYDDSAPDKVTSYKLLFCDVKGGDVKAIWKGIETCTGSHGIEGTKGISSDDMAAIKGKIATYYKRAAKQFDDDSIVVPWGEKRRAILNAIIEQKMSGLQVLTYGLSTIDDYSDFIDAWLERIGDTCGLDLDPDEGYESDDVGGQLVARPVDGMAVHPVVKALLDNVPGLQDALLKLGDAFQALDDASDAVLDLLGMNDSNGSDASMYGYMLGRRPTLDVKVSKQLSAANRKTIGDAMDHIKQGHSMLGDMMSMNDPSRPSGSDKKSASRQVGNIGDRQPEPLATTDDSPTGEPDPVLDTTLQRMVDEAKVFALLDTLRS